MLCDVGPRAILTSNKQTHFATADLRHPAEVFAAPQVSRLDFTRPLVLLQCATLHHVDDADDPWTSMREYVDALPSMQSGRYRTREEIARFFAGLDLVEPGLVEMDDWWPAGPEVEEANLTQRLVLAGVGRKP